MNLCGIALLQNIRSYLRYITKFKVGTPFIPISFHYWSPPPLNNLSKYMRANRYIFLLQLLTIYCFFIKIYLF